MKELSIEQKAERYDEAIERAKNTIEVNQTIPDIVECVEFLFPELAESEDEKIRKEIIEYIKTGTYHKDWIAWLEKQVPACPSHDDKIMIRQLTEYFTTGKGLQNTNDTVVEWLADVKRKLEKQDKNNMGISEATKQKLEDNLNKALEKETPESWNKFLEKQGEHANFLSKIQVGDKVTRNKNGVLVNLSQLNRVANKDKKQGGRFVRWEKNTADNKPALNHSVLMKNTHGVAEGEWNGREWIQYRWSCKVKDSDVLYWMDLPEFEKQCEHKPAYTKEYDFHGIKFIPKFAKGDIIKDKKRGEISTIEDFSYDTGLYTHTYGQFPITIQDDYEKVKPIAWSEEDEEILYSIINDIEIRSGRITLAELKESYTKQIDWLKSLKDRVLPQPKQEWSEEDEAGLGDALWAIEQARTIAKDENDMGNLWYAENWLKSLRPQATWKPSDEQMVALDGICSYIRNKADWEISQDTIYELYSLSEQLKKLREE